MMEWNRAHLENHVFIDDEATIRRRPSPRRCPSQPPEKFIIPDDGAQKDTDFDSLLCDSRYDYSDEIDDMSDEENDAFLAEHPTNESHQALDDTLNTSNINWALRFSKQFEGKQNERYRDSEMTETPPTSVRQPEIMDIQAKINSINQKYKDIFDVKQDPRDIIVKDESVTMQRALEEEKSESNIELNIGLNNVPLSRDNSLSLADITRDFIAMEVSIKHLGHSIKERLSRIQNLHIRDCDKHDKVSEQVTFESEEDIILKPDYQVFTSEKTVPTTSIVKSLRFDPCVETAPNDKPCREHSNTSYREWHHSVKSQDIVKQSSSLRGQKDIFSRRIVTKELPKKEMESSSQVDVPINNGSLPHTSSPVLEMKSSYLLSSNCELPRETSAFSVYHSPPQRESSINRDKQFSQFPPPALKLHSSFLLQLD